ncbi:MAG: hypothetical protein AB7S38_27570 [Vulcanimicrobiota bacterium]
MLVYDAPKQTGLLSARSAPPKSAPQSGPAPAALPTDQVQLDQAAQTPQGIHLKPWQKWSLIGLGAIGVIGGLISAATPPAPPPEFSQSEVLEWQGDPTSEQWQRLSLPGTGETRPIVPGLHADGLAPVTISETRDRMNNLTFHDIDPYVASIANSIDAGRGGGVRDEMKIKLRVLDQYDDRFDIRMGLQNGPNAPMLVILPGIYGDPGGSLTVAFKRMALERGMNYVAIPNALSKDAMTEDPFFHPGNPGLEARAVRDIVSQLKERYPDYFGQVSVAGYSYGALLGANAVRYDEELADAGQPRLFTGSLVALSPPENLYDSMHALDGLRQHYEGPSVEGSIIFTGLKYRNQVREYGYERFMESELASRHQNTTDIKIADRYGSRDGMEDMIDRVDRQFDHDLLPAHRPENRWARGEERNQIMREHYRALHQLDYDQFSDVWMSQDAWLRQHQMTPQQMSSEYSYSRALEVIDDTPVMTIVSQDDYILLPENVETYRQLEGQQGPNEALHVYERGGHVGIMFNPEVKDAMIDFAHSPPAAETAVGSR